MRVARRMVVVAVAWVVTGCRDPLELASTEQLTVVLNPSIVSFPTTVVGQTSAAIAITIDPGAGNQDDTITEITESCPDFAITTPGLPASVYRVCEPDCGGTPCVAKLAPITSPIAPPACITTSLQAYTFTAEFTPSIGGAQGCSVSISLNGGTSFRTVSLEGTGTVPPIVISVSPSAIAFGDVRINTDSSPAAVAVRNLGGSTLTVSAASVSAGFTLAGAPAFAVAAGGAEALDVTCHPTAVGDQPGTLTIESDDPDQPILSIPLACGGIDSNLAISPSPAVIAATRVGEPVQQTITLANVGGAATSITGVTVDGAGLTLVSGPAAGTVLNASETSAVVVAFDAIAPGPASGTLNVMTTDGLRTTPITATATVAALALSPDGVVDFGPVCVGQVATRSFTARGVGDGDLLLSAISDPGAPFAVVAAGLPATVLAAGGNEVTFAVTAAPVAEGLRTSTLAVATDIPGGTPRVIEVNVTGLAGGVSATPLELDLGSHALDVTTLGEVLMLTNCGVDPIDFANARVEGTDSQSFTLVAQPTSTTIAASSSASWLVVFHATSVGNKTADFAVDHGGQTSRIVLFGEGLTDEVAGIAPNDPRSYYSCSAGGVSALWPMVLAFAVVTRRKRRAA